MKLNNKKNILICPLEWGLGHAGRMVPLAKKLKELNNNIFFGSGKEHLSFLRGEVQGATFIYFPGSRISYSRYLPQYLVVLFNLPLLLCHSVGEHYRLKKIVRDYSIDIVISDNRLGLWHTGIKSVFITHQLRIPFPKPFRFLEQTGIWICRSIAKKYTWCYVPDLEGEINVSGRLSHGFRLPENVRFIGILSRLGNQFQDENQKTGGYTVILSGPEPQRSILKQKLTAILKAQKVPAVMLEGKPGKTGESYTLENILYYKHLPPDETIKLLRRSETIITRSGYTTIMELITLGMSALLIPTPGQTEQEYLAEYLSGKGWFCTVSQKDIKNNMSVTSATVSLPSVFVEESERLLGIALSELLE